MTSTKAISRIHTLYRILRNSQNILTYYIVQPSNKEFIIPLFCRLLVFYLLVFEIQPPSSEARATKENKTVQTKPSKWSQKSLAIPIKKYIFVLVAKTNPSLCDLNKSIFFCFVRPFCYFVLPSISALF